MIDLPIESAIPEIREALRAGGSLVLQAPPGAGKTTRVPLALLEEDWLGGRAIIMLEPRRLAARAAAARMASMLGEAVGGTVGYRVRLDSRVSAATRIEVVTEGILTRMLQSDPSLDRVGLLLFDEFHERSIHADLGLALSLQSRALLRPDLRIGVMSATLDGEAVARLLTGAEEPAPIVTTSGRSYAVDTQFLARPIDGWIEPAVVRAIMTALEDDEGDLLVFLPGSGEIRRVEQQLREQELPTNIHIYPLYGLLSQGEQDRAIRPSREGERKVVLATSIAETSLTIEGVRVVIDSGLMRVPRFSPRVGMTRLETVPVTRASADQRRGRAGRTAPGVCYRLWTEDQDRGLLAQGLPEIRSADLAPLALELAAWGARDPKELAWLDPPAEGAYAQAQELLRELGALRDGTITEHGRKMAEFGAHPRLAHMAIRGAELGHGALACDLAAILGERDLLNFDRAGGDADIHLRLAALAERSAAAVAGFRVDRTAADRARAEARAWRARLRVTDSPRDADAAGLLLGLAYPDRVAQQRGGEGRYLLRNGSGGSLRGAQALGRSPYLAVAEVDGPARDARIAMAAPISLDEIETLFADQITTEESIQWEGGAVRALRRSKLGALVLREALVRDPDPERIRSEVSAAIRREGISSLPWTRGARQLQQRIAFLRSQDSEWPDASEEALTRTLEVWLGPHLHGLRRKEEIDRLDLESILLDSLPWDRRRALDDLAPTHYVVPSGSSLPIDYADPAAPTIRVRLQEVFGLAETPRIGGGRIPLVIELLSPAQRPVQVTRDLASFWRGAYFDVRKDLRGRYPKHYWPDDPLAAEPTRRTKKKG